MFSSNIHQPTEVVAQEYDGSTWLRLANATGFVSAFMPRHVARATAAAFNRAAQVQEAPGGLVYATPVGGWFVDVEQARGEVWTGQYEDVTGDGDPSYMFASAPSLEALQDEIDALIEDHACAECNTLVGDTNLVLVGGQTHCETCHDAAATRVAELAEMAADDMAHAHAERAAGL